MKTFLGVMLFLSVTVNILLAGCQIVPQESPAELKSLARRCNVDPEGKNTKELTEAIEQKYQILLDKAKKAASSGESIRYYGSILTAEDWTHIRFSLKSRPATIETIEKNDRFIKKIKGKDLKILSDED